MDYNYEYVDDFINKLERIDNDSDARTVFTEYSNNYNFLLVIESLKDSCKGMFKKNEFDILELNIDGIKSEYISDIKKLQCPDISGKDPKEYILQVIGIDIEDIKDKYIKFIPDYIDENKKNNIIQILKRDKDIFNFLRNIYLLISDHGYTKQEQLRDSLKSADDSNKIEQRKLLLKHIYETMFGKIGDKEFSNNIICIDVNFYNKSNNGKLILHIYYIFILLYKIINPFVDIAIENLTIELIKGKINLIVNGTPPTDNIKMHGFTIKSASYLMNCFENISIFKIKLTGISKLLDEYNYWISLIERLYYLYPYKHTIENIKIPYTISKNNKIYLKNKIKSKLPYIINMKSEYLKNKKLLKKTPQVDVDVVRGEGTYISSYHQKNALQFDSYNNPNFIDLINIGLYYKNLKSMKLERNFDLSNQHFTKTEYKLKERTNIYYTLNNTFFNEFIDFYINNYNVNIIIIANNQKSDGFLIYTNTITSIDKCVNTNDPIVLYYNKVTIIKPSINKTAPVYYFDLVIKINNILLNKI